MIDALGYDFKELWQIHFLDGDPEPHDCPMDSCYGGCTPECFSCKNGNK